MSTGKREVILRFQGLKFVVPKETECFWPYYGICFAGEYDAILERVSSSDIVVDAGANIGIFTLLSSRKARMVIAVEPDPENFTYLERNVELNNAKNVVLINKALSDYVGNGFIQGKGLSTALSPSGIPVKVTTIDEIIRDLNLTSFDILKMDIEGAELKALKGDFLGSIKGLIVEIHDKVSYKIISDRLRAKGFILKEWTFSPLKTIKRILTNFGSFIDAELRNSFMVTTLALKYAFGFSAFPIPPADQYSEIKLIIAWKPDLLQ